MLQTFNFKLSTFATPQQWVREAKPWHFLAQMWNYIMHQKTQPSRYTN